MAAYERVWVSRHAQIRYLLRINADCVDARWPLIDMWQHGRPASDDDLSVFSAKRHDDQEYRVSAAENGLYYLMVARNKTLVTVIEMHWR